jgi:hypothetical protein
MITVRLFDLMKDYPVLNLKIFRLSCGAKKAISVDFDEARILMQQIYS